MNCSLCKYRSNVLGFESEVGHAQISHHHHVEGCLEKCPKCGLNHCDCNQDHQKISEDNLQIHSHQHVQYPNSEHPLGPVTLRYF